jgi:plastocyanin
MKLAAILILPSLVVGSFYVMSLAPAPSMAASAAEVAAPHGKSSAGPTISIHELTISIHEFMFSPTSLTVTAGTTVHWKNLDPEPHTIRAVDATFKSDALDQDDSFNFTFDKPGTYRYVCSIHPQMVGTIVVKSAAH